MAGIVHPFNYSGESAIEQANFYFAPQNKQYLCFLRYINAQPDKKMKKIHIVMLVLIAAGVASLSLLLKDLTTYASFAVAKEKYRDKYVHIVAELDKTRSIDWNPEKNPNYLAFYAKDSLGSSTKVIYHNNMPNDFEKSSKLVLKGYMRTDYFECKEMQLKCPSKYKDQEQAGAQHPENVERTAAPISNASFNSPSNQKQNY
jgi:cytochrome c-type biogenesis protein CcmE